MTESRRCLPEDLVVEILSRVPAISLARFRYTSKRWNALINDGRFTKKHSANTPRPSRVIIMLIDFKIYLASFDLRGIDDNIVKVTRQFSLKDPLSHNYSKEVDIRNLFNCDGLLLCTTKDNRLVVWNPCSGETRWIQPRNSYKKLDFYALGKSSCNNKYKILRMNQHGDIEPCRVESEIYDFTSNSWRSIGETIDDWFIPRCKGRGMYLNGNAYWLASTQDLVNGNFFLSFDFSTERFTSVSLPGDHLSYHLLGLSVTREEQQLCMIARSKHGFDIHVWLATKIESTTSWSKLLTVERAYNDLPFYFVNGMNFLADPENKVIVCPGKNGISNSFLHIVAEDKYIQVDHHDAGSKCSLLLTYLPTLVQYL